MRRFGRAVVALREQWLSDLETVRTRAGIRSVRFHGLFNDEMGDPLLQTEDKYSNEGQPITLNLTLQGGRNRRRAHLTRVDDDHGSAASAYRRIGSPAYPTAQQISERKDTGRLASPHVLPANEHGELTVTLPANGLALLEIA